MGSSLFSIIADIMMQELELEALHSLTFPVSFYLRYVDDIIFSIPKDKIDYTLNIFNSIHTRIKFTHKVPTTLIS